MKKKTATKVKPSKSAWMKSGKKWIYIFKESVAKKYRLSKIEFIGFPTKAKPTGFNLYDTGGGFNRFQLNKFGGTHLLEFLADYFPGKRLELVIHSDSDAKPLLRNVKRVTRIKLSKNDFLLVVVNLGNEIKKNKHAVVAGKLLKYFDEFRPKKSASLSEMLATANLSKLEDSDHDAVIAFIRGYFGSNSNREARKALQRELVIKGQKENLEDVIRQFERNLSNKKFSESEWQKFLHEDVFYFLSNYIYSIREADVNFGKPEDGVKKPDFVWIDIDGFLDIFEIKTPQTTILAKRIDKSHDNYYLSTEASKAISQIEKYVLFIEKNVDKFATHLSTKTGIPFSVLKPKAFLIIGNSEEFEKHPAKKRDFRLLRRTLKNVEFITFNELLDNLKNLSGKFRDRVDPHLE